MAGGATDKAAKGPAGFDAVDYPDVARVAMATLYICQTCYPVWDTLDLDAAKAHPGTTEHAEGTERATVRAAR